MHRQKRTQLFVETIRKWYSNHKRTLPWRDLQVADDTQRAYMVLVSEIMLQQTQVPRVIITFKNFLRQFPTLEALAAASNKDILIAWRGMGYNSRALRLRDAARIIIDEFGGVFPSDFEQLLSIKGIGHYTAGAVRNFAFNIPTPCIDTNIRRILHRTFVGPENPDGTWKKDDNYLLEIASEVLVVALNNQMTSADWHAALMDYGSLVQTKSNPKWEICPLTRQGIMMTTKKNFEKRMTDYEKSFRNPKFAIRNQRKEPGRYVGSKYVPNRIFRGRIVEALRDAPEGLPFENIGKEIAIDWSDEHKPWLKKLITKLVQDALLERSGDRYALKV